MATPRIIYLSPETRGLFSVDAGKSDVEASAKKTSEILQRNHEKAHIFVNEHMMHNHIVHHILTIFALGASPDQLQKAYDLNQYQRPAIPQHDLVEKMTNLEEFSKYLGQEEYFSDYLEYFTREMEKTSWQEVVNEYLFKKDARAEDMLTRTFAGYLHPLIHLGFGIDFGQPAIVAEALAQAAVHSPWIGPLLLGAEKAAAEDPKSSKTFVELLEAIQIDEKLRNATSYSESPPFRKGIMGRGLIPMIKHTSQFTVDESEIDSKKIEVLEAAAYICGAAQRSLKEIKIDFLAMHGVNATILVSAILEQPWLSIQNKTRLLEWVGRFLLALYCSNHVAPLHVSEVSDYIPKKSSLGDEGSWYNIISRAVDVSDDGHVAKLIRALAFGEKACVGWEEKTPLIVNGKMWRQIGSMTVDSTELKNDEWGAGLDWKQMYRLSNMKWVRGAGYDEAWEPFGER